MGNPILNKPTILWADDDRDDSEFFRYAFRRYNDRFNLVQVDSGAGVLAYLEGKERPMLPSLLVLDINMPELNGTMLLTLLKEDARYRGIPVVMVSTSNNMADQRFCEKFGVIILTKPDCIEDIEVLVQQLVSVA